ncbi:MAG: RHS repeat-associated core domain-containing protein [Anaerovoracaceae bacterium]
MEIINGIVAESGAAVKAYKYDEFGNTESFGNLDNEIAYTGGIYDKSTQLYYLNARYYNPDDGRFITQDSYRGSNEDIGTWHLYAYCGNNPVNYVDPSGHKFERPKTGTKRWACLLTTKKKLREVIAPVYKSDPTKVALKKYFLEYLTVGSLEDSFEYTLKLRKVFTGLMKSAFKIWGYWGMLQNTYGIMNCFWSGHNYRIWKNIDDFYKTSLRYKYKDRKKVWFCQYMSYKRHSGSGAYIPTGQILLSVYKKKQVHSH